MDASNHEVKAPKLWGWQTALSISMTAAILIGLATLVDLNQVWRRAAASRKEFLLLGMAAHYATYPLRGLRWRLWLKQMNGRCGWKKYALIVFFYNAVDNVVPAKLGDVYGAHLVRINCGIRRSAALGALAFIRMVDAWLVLVSAGVASLALFSNRLPQSVIWALAGGAIIAILATLILSAFLVLRRKPPEWLPDGMNRIVKGFHAGMWMERGQVLPIAFLTIAIWALEITWIYLLVAAFGIDMDAIQVTFLTMVPILASVFPLTPSGAGVVEVTLYTCLRLVNISSPLAVSITVVNRFIDYWLHIALGALTWALRKWLGFHTLREVAGFIEADEEADGELQTLVRQADLP